MVAEGNGTLAEGAAVPCREEGKKRREHCVYLRVCGNSRSATIKMGIDNQKYLKPRALLKEWKRKKGRDLLVSHRQFFTPVTVN